MYYLFSYTTVQTITNKMVTKKFLRKDWIGKTNYYTSIKSKEDSKK